MQTRQKGGSSHMWHRRVMLVLSLLLSLTLVSCTGGKAPETKPGSSETPTGKPADVGLAPGEVYKVGVLLNLTGANADPCASGKVGYEIAKDQINAQGGILGHQVELDIRDDKLDPSEAIKQLKDLLLRVKVHAVMLAPAGVTQLPTLAVCKEEEVLAFGMQGQDEPYLNDNMYPYYFIVGPSARQEAYGLAKYVANRKDIKTYVTIAPDYSWGRANVQNFMDTAKKLRPELKCLGNFWPPLAETEFGSYITSILAKNADICVSWLWGTNFLNFVKQAQGYKFLDKTKLMAWVEYDSIITGGKDIPSGVIVEADNEYWCNRKNQNPYYEQFEKEYVARRGRLPALQACQCYDMFMTLMQGIKKAGSFNKDAVAKAIEGSTFMTLSGPDFMRPIDHCFESAVYFGVTRFDPALGHCDAVDIVEIPGNEIMAADAEYIRYRQEKKIDFKPWHENWYKTFPWAE